MGHGRAQRKCPKFAYDCPIPFLWYIYCQDIGTMDIAYTGPRCSQWPSLPFCSEAVGYKMNKENVLLLEKRRKRIFTEILVFQRLLDFQSRFFCFSGFFHLLCTKDARIIAKFFLLLLRGGEEPSEGEKLHDLWIIEWDCEKCILLVTFESYCLSQIKPFARIPISDFSVGAAAYCESGSIYCGVNIEMKHISMGQVTLLACFGYPSRWSMLSNVRSRMRWFTR